MSHPVLEPEITGENTRSGRWMVVIHNNETNSFDEVIDILMIATDCDAEEAQMEAWEAHHFGKAPVHFASRTICQEAARIISSVGIKTDVSKEWNE